MHSLSYQAVCVVLEIQDFCKALGATHYFLLRKSCLRTTQDKYTRG
jgi:hypothetical protein